MGGKKYGVGGSLFFAVGCSLVPVSACFGLPAPTSQSAAGNPRPGNRSSAPLKRSAVLRLRLPRIWLRDQRGCARLDPRGADSAGRNHLKKCHPSAIAGLQAGDRILVGGKLGEDSQDAKRFDHRGDEGSDVAAKQEHDREDWQKRGIGRASRRGGCCKWGDHDFDSLLSGNKAVTIHAAKNTIIRRYAPDSIKFEDAKLATLADIKAGDQLRARGARSADGSELDAEEIVSGTFRNLAGTVVSTDSAANTITILDLATKKPVLVRVTAESQLRKLPAMVAQRIAMRLKGGSGAAAGGSGAQAAPANSGTQTLSPVPPSSGGTGERPHMNGSPDFQQILSRMPPATIADLQKGDAVMIVSTEGTTAGGVTAITLLAGVEPILQSSPKGGQAMILSPWSLGGGAAGGGRGKPVSALAK